MNGTQTQLDPSVVALTKAIGQSETGGKYTATGKSGEYGAYQYTADTWAGDSKKYLGQAVPLMEASPEQQDKVAYSKIYDLGKQGYTPAQVASIWNSGKPDSYADPNSKGVNKFGVNYDVPAYVNSVAKAYQSNLQGQSVGADPNNPSSIASQNPTQSTPESPSVGGFLGNVVQSGANFVGNIGNAILHPIQTVQNIGGAAVGGLQELGGQQNENTQKFDSLVGYFKDRYGGIDNLLHTAYTDPVGLAGDIAAVFGVGEGALAGASKASEIAGAGTRALSGIAEGTDFVAGAEGASNATRAVAGSGLAGGLQDASNVAGKVSSATNPLTPIVKGASALLNQTKGISDVIAHPSDYTPEQIANSSGEKIANDVQSAFDAKRASLSETGGGYNPIKQTPTPITVTPDSLDSIIRDTLKLDVTDGVIKPTSTSLLRDSAGVSKLQSLYNTYKTDFLNGTMTSEKFLNLRSDLSKIAFNDLGIKNSEIAQNAAKLRGAFNDAFRPQVTGLKELDASYESQINKINELEDGLVYKTGANKGEIKTSFISKASKALKTGNDEQLSQLEEILPGITKRLQVMKTIKDLGNAYSPLSITEKAGLAGSLLTGNIKGAAVAFTSIILSKPEVAVPLMRAIGAHLDLVKAVMANLAKYTTLGAVGNNISGSSGTTSPIGQSQSTEQSNQQPIGTDQQTTATPIPQSGTDLLPQNSSSPNPIINNFDMQAALKAGYTQQEIDDFLKTQK